MENHIPLLIEFLFAESAPTANLVASDRLLLWSQAFDSWLAELSERYSPSRRKTAVAAWRRLLRLQPKPPWELLPADMAQHIAWMQAQGYAPGTIAVSLRVLSDFYRWCAYHELEPRLTNPVEHLSKPKARRYEQATLLSRVEQQALLGILARDESPVGKRDHAFFLARLYMGIPLEDLRRLQWGQIMPGEDAPAQGRLHQQIPGEVQEAILAYLGASGRLAGMQPGMSVFAPQADSVKDAMGSRATDWCADRYISYNQLLKSLKKYGGLVKIPSEKLNLNVLRYTAIRLHLDQGASLEQMRAFMGSRLLPHRLASLLRNLPPLPEDGPQAGEIETQALPPNRQPKLLQPGEGITHGLYARRQPSEAVKAVMAENIQGVDEEILGMRGLARGLDEWVESAKNSKEAAQIINTITLVSARLGDLIRFAKLLVKNKKDREVDDLRAQWEKSITPEGLEDWPEPAMGSRRVVEEIANVRLALRRALARALKAKDDIEYIGLVKTYSIGCNRLMRLLRAEKANLGQFEEYLREALDKALTELRAEGFMK